MMVKIIDNRHKTKILDTRKINPPLILIVSINRFDNINQPPKKIFKQVFRAKYLVIPDLATQYL